MKALLLGEYRRLQVVDWPRPDMAADEVLIRVAACGICGSDVHGYDGATGRRIPPLIMGHEAAGVIEGVGGDVAGFRPGDRVTFDSTVYCGQCPYCRSGRANLCDARQVLGVSCGDYRRHGAFAEYVAVPARIVYRLPDRLPAEHAALIEAASVALHAVRRRPPEREEDVLVVGAGMIGLLVVQVLKHHGCRRLIAVDVDDARLGLAQQFGATDVLSARRGDVADAVRSLTDDRGVDAAWEAVGVTGTVQSAVNCVRKGGAVTLIGNASPAVELPLQTVVTRELALYGSCASSGEYPQCIELLASGTLNVAPLISAVVSLEDAPAWFERLYAREPGLMKVIVKPS
ncbi:MAG: galactitol-1-phosphate 5-dehydrogenase [Planctomycetota bacterium]|nr:MAG: galactitol-1-phosphate 5-dehydrogenase [Planctomycetota bacterium]